jgi:hypothetical protein
MHFANEQNDDVFSAFSPVPNLSGLLLSLSIIQNEKCAYDKNT